MPFEGIKMTLRKKFYPWAAALPRKTAVNAATLFGLGNFSAPGTWGTAAGVLFYALLFKSVDIVPFVVFAAVFAYAAVGICDAAEKFLGQRDPHNIILDEFVAVPVCFIPLAGHSFSAMGMIAGFVIFRFLDIRKPLFINKMQSLEGGLGCVADDIAAALVTCVCVNLLGLIASGIFSA